MPTKNDIKVVAPANNPHICYIPRSYESKVQYVKKNTGLSVYRMICVSAEETLSDKSKISKFKRRLRGLGYKTIGEWVVKMIDIIYETKDFENIPKPMKKENN